MNVDSSSELARRISLSTSLSEPVRTTLSTNARVLARVTDGIYRQPGSALRELISNAYDADATRVIVRTDAPRFLKISVEDDGSGMTPDVLAHVLRNIGGSAKRTKEGTDLGISGMDPVRSPGGRRLIGKLGIGLFSVSQLTRAFQIITKVRGDSYKTIATVKLRQFSDLPPEDVDEQPEDGYEAGEVLIWRERSDQAEQHGTTIVLTSIRPQTREALQSQDIWQAIDSARADDEDIDPEAFIPEYHIGRVDVNGEYKSYGVDSSRQSLPWDSADSPADAFRKVVNSAWEITSQGNPNPTLDRLFDNYLKMVWELGLALPVAYVDGHLFDEPASDWARFYRLSNEGRPSVAQLVEPKSASVRDQFGLLEGASDGAGFNVFVDDLQILRPIRFRGLPVTNHAVKTPLVFLGSFEERFDGVPVESSGGALKFEAYFYWSPKIAPVDHRGALVRIFGASGAPFDHSFFRYQVSEQTRLRQITCEVFVSQGLESALNIDREAFNTSHPHMVVLMKWVHNALRQIATAQKRAAQEVRAKEREEDAHSEGARLARVVDAANRRLTGGDAPIPSVSLAPEIGIQLDDGAFAKRNDEVTLTITSRRPFGRTAESRANADKLKAIAQILSVSGAFDTFTPTQVDEIVNSIRDVLESDS